MSKKKPYMNVVVAGLAHKPFEAALEKFVAAKGLDLGWSRHDRFAGAIVFYGPMSEAQANRLAAIMGKLAGGARTSVEFV